jgi:hypothetical protein
MFMRLKLLLLLILSGFLMKPIKCSAQVTVQDSLALVDLYNSTNGNHWGYNTNWLSSKPVSTWLGISVTGNRVTGISISINNLVGSLPASICNLTQLTDLELYQDRLNGSIPDSIGKLTNLQFLHLENNQLSGSIPLSIGNLSNLVYLSIYNNSISGGVPSSLSNLSSLQSLWLSGNPLGGAIPSSLGNLSNLQYLSLNGDQLIDSIPSSLGNLTNLVSFDLSGNQLSGSIPYSLNALSNLYYFDVSNNQLSGDITSLDNFNPALDIYINNNQFTFAGMEQVVKAYNKNFNDDSSSYWPQSPIIPIIQKTDTLSVSVGGTLSNNTYRWYSTTAGLVATINGDSTFIPTSSFTGSYREIVTPGNYYATVTNSIATQLTLNSDTIAVHAINVPLCTVGYGDTLYLKSSLSGTNYQWQVNANDSFVNISDGSVPPLYHLAYSNTKTDTLKINVTSTSYYGYQYRCIVDGDTSEVYTLKFIDNWTGAVDSTWENPLNWSCDAVPDANTDVYINNGAFPPILSSNTTVRSITVNPNASLIIVSPFNLTVTH